MATSHINVTPGDGTKKAATHTISEDAVTKDLQRIVTNTPVGVDQSFGAGNTDAGTMRIVLSADEALLELLNLIGAIDSTAVPNGTDPTSLAGRLAGSSNQFNTLLALHQTWDTEVSSTPFKSLDLDETEEQVKATAGLVFFVVCINLAATKRYLKFFNATAANVTVGTTVPVLTLPIPTLGDTNGAGFVLNVPGGISFDTAITVAATTGFADADTGAPGANEVILNLGYA